MKRLLSLGARHLSGRCAILLLGLGWLAASSAGQTTATWTGAAGDGLYATAGNWDIGMVPLNDGMTTYDVVIPAAFTVYFDVDVPGTVTDLNLAAGSTLYIDPGTSLTVLDDAHIAGVISADDGDFLALAAGAAFYGNQSRLGVYGGGQLALAATTYSSQGLTANNTTHTLFSAHGAGSVLDLSTLQTLNASFNDNSGYVTVHRVLATNSGVLDLSGLQDVTGPWRGEDRFEFVISNDGTLPLTGLQSVSGGYVRFLISTPSYALPSLLTVANTTFDLAVGTTLDVPLLTTFSGGTLNVPSAATVNANNLLGFGSSTNALNIADGGALNAPQLVSLQYAVVSLNPLRTFVTGPLQSLDNSKLAVAGGMQFGCAYGDVVAPTYSSQGLTAENTTHTLLSVDGTGSVLDLSSLQTLNGSFNDNSGYTTVHRVAATNGGVLDLSSVQNVTGPIRGEDRLEFVLNSGGVLDLTGLQSVNGGYVRFQLNAPSYMLPALSEVARTTFDLAAGTTLDLPVLTTFAGGTLNVPSGATLNANNLVALSGSTNTVNITDGGAINAPQLVTVQYGVLSLNPARTFVTGALQSLDNSKIAVAGGLQFGCAYGDVTAATYSSQGLTADNTTHTLFSVDGTGSVLDLSSLQTFNAACNDKSGYTTVHRVTATNGGTLDLSSVQTIAGPARGEDRFEVTAESGGTVNLSHLQSVTGTGPTKFTIGGAATMLFGNLTASSNVQIAVTDVTSTMDVAGNLFLDAGSFSIAAGGQVSVGKNFQFAYTAEANMSAQAGILEFDGTMPQYLEIGGTDVGIPPPDESVLNFGLGQLIVGTDTQPTVVQLMEVVNNGNRGTNVPEALYLYGLGGPDGLVIKNGSTLRLNALNCYAKIGGVWVDVQSLFEPGETEIPFDEGYIRRDGGTGVVGDLDCSGRVGFGDINPFVLVLTNPAAYEAMYPDCDMGLGDINGDRTVDFGDINPFVTLITQAAK